MRALPAANGIDAQTRQPGEKLSPPGMFWLGLVSVVSTALIYSLPRISFSSLRLLDVDGYMRAQRVVDLIAGGNSWFDSWVHRANAPFGHALHWTRPVDALLVGLSWPLTFVLDLKRAVFWGSFVFGFLMSAAVFLAVAWAARAIVGSGASYLAAAATAFQVGLVAYNSPGHPDHHGLILLTSALLIGHTLRLLRFSSRALTWRAGAVAALGLWVATEFLLPLVVCLSALVWKWISSGEGLATIRAFTASLSLGLVVALAIERHPDSWLLLEAERISLLHVLMAGLLTCAAWGWSRWKAPERTGRLWLALVSGGSIAVVLQFVFPGFFLGPVAAIPPVVDRFFDDYITEFAATWHAVGRSWAGLALVLGAPLIGLAASLFGLVRSGRTVNQAPWALLVSWSAITLGLALVSFRYVPMAELFAAVPLAGAVERNLWESSRGTMFRRPILIAATLVGYLALVVAGSAFDRGSANPPTPGCDLEEIARDLREGLGAVPADSIVLAGIPYGPELMWRLPVRVVGTPYLNPEGISFTNEVFGTANFDKAVENLDQRQVTAVIVCEGEPASAGFRTGDSFYNALINRRSIPGFTAIALEPESAWRVYLRSSDLSRPSVRARLGR